MERDISIFRLSSLTLTGGITRIPELLSMAHEYIVVWGISASLKILVCSIFLMSSSIFKIWKTGDSYGHKRLIFYSDISSEKNIYFFKTHIIFYLCKFNLFKCYGSVHGKSWAPSSLHPPPSGIYGHWCDLPPGLHLSSMNSPSSLSHYS